MEIMQWLHETGNGGCDHSAIVKFYEQLDNISLKQLCKIGEGDDLLSRTPG
jgi:hypothetical protein